jgi:hypothetical protein
MNKKQAAKFLRVSTRAIERYVAKGKLPVRYTKDKTGRQVAVFDESQVKKITTELETLAHSQTTPKTPTDGKTNPALMQMATARSLSVPHSFRLPQP